MLSRVLTVHVWLKHNGLAIVRKTTKLIEVVTVVFRTIGIYLFTSTFFYVFTLFVNQKKIVTFYVFCRVSYVCSNYRSQA